jgi:hypothetical protein
MKAKNNSQRGHGQGKPGFLRPWNTEFEAVARLGHAFAPQAPSLHSPGHYVSDGVFKKLSAGKASLLLAEAFSFNHSNQEHRHLAYLTRTLTSIA